LLGASGGADFNDAPSEDGEGDVLWV